MTVEKLLEILSTKGNGQFIKVRWMSNLSGKQGAKGKVVALFLLMKYSLYIKLLIQV